MLVRKSKSLVLGVAVAALFCGVSAHAGLVTNGGFESGDFTGWTTSLDPVFDGVDSLAPQSGSFAAFFGNVGGVSTISQALATVAGTTYDISFWLMNEADPTGLSAPNSFELDWGGASVMALTDASEFGYTKYEFQLVAGAASTDLSFKFNQVAAFWDFDSVDVLAVAKSVPEPGSFALVALAGALALLPSSRRRAPKSRRSSISA